MTSFRGVVKDNVVVLPENLELANGHIVEVRVLIDEEAEQKDLQLQILSQENNVLVEELAQARKYIGTLHERLKDQQVLAVVSQKIVDSTHVRNNKLGAVMLYADDIARGYYDESPQRVKDVAKRIVREVRYYLDFLSAAQDLTNQTITTLLDLHSVIDEVLASKSLKGTLTIIKEYQASDPFVQAPPQQLRQVLLVAVQNILIAMVDEQATLRMETQTVSTKGMTFVQVLISDTCAIPPLDQTKHNIKVGELVRLDQQYIDSNLGLTWGRSFLQSYGGELTFETTVIGGRNIYLLIPRSFEIASPSH